MSQRISQKILMNLIRCLYIIVGEIDLLVRLKSIYIKMNCSSLVSLKLQNGWPDLANFICGSSEKV